MQTRFLLVFLAALCISMLMLFALGGDSLPSLEPTSPPTDGHTAAVSRTGPTEAASHRVEASPSLLPVPGVAASSPLCSVPCKALFEITSRPVVGANISARNIRSGELITAVTGGDGAALLTFFVAGDYQVEAAREGMLVSDSTLGPRAFRVPTECNALQFSFAEPYVCAFAINGEQPYDVRFEVERRGFAAEPARSPAAARLAKKLQDDHGCNVKLYFVRNIQVVPVMQTSLFTRGHGIVTRDVPLVPLGIFSEPYVFDLRQASGRTESATVDYRCHDVEGVSIDLGPILLRRKEPVAGFVSTWIRCNSQVEVPPGMYLLDIVSVAFPWLLREWLPQHRTLDMAAGQAVPLVVRIAEPMLDIKVQHELEGLVFARFGVMGPMGMSYGAAIATNNGTTLRVPASATEAIWYLNNERRGTIYSERWMSTRVFRPGQD